MRRFLPPSVVGLLLVGLAMPPLKAEEPSAVELRRQHETMLAKATSFLLTKGRASDGSYSSFSGPGVTSLVTTALLQNGLSPSDPRIEASLAYIREHVKP